MTGSAYGTARGWLFGCGCGNEVSVKNQRVIHSKEPCKSCLGFLSDEFEVSVNAELGWCACGNPEDVDALMLRYLSVVPAWEHEGQAGLTSSEYMLLAYIADDLRWTEHGGGVYGAWLTDDGREALAALRERAPDSGNVWEHADRFRQEQAPDSGGDE